MKLYRLGAQAMIVCAFAALLVTSVSAKEKWINLTTRNFNVVSNAGEDQTRKLALKLEQFRHIFSSLFKTGGDSSVPITVMVFKSDGSFKPFKPLYNGKPKNIAGYFQRTQDENIIALNIDSNPRDEHPMSVIYHEYTHLLTAYTRQEWPLWLKEGVAELYSTFDIDKNGVTIGKPISNHVLYLQSQKLIPLRTLFGVGHDSPIYNEGEKQGVFYAQSWILMHYLMFGEKMARQPLLVQFARLLESGVPAEQAFTQAFKTDFASLEKELRRYMSSGTYTQISYKLANTEGEKEISARPVADAEAQFYLGNLLLRTSRIDEAEAFFKQAVALDPTLARPYEGLGFISMRRNKYDEAREHFKQAASRDSKNYLAHYYYAEALREEAMSGGSGIDSIKPETAETINEELRTSIKLMPGFAPPYRLMGFMSMVTGENLEEAERAMQTALRLEPQDKHSRLTLAQIQVHMQNYPSAKQTLAPLLAADDDPGVKSSAESMISMIETYTRPLPDPSAGKTAENELAEGGERPQPKRREQAGRSEEQGEKGAARSFDSNARPTLKLEGTQTIGGYVAAIECRPGEWTLVIRTPDSTLRFIVTDVGALQFYSQDPDFNESVGCGPVELQGFVYFKPVGAQSKFAGDAVAVEFIRQ